MHWNSIYRWFKQPMRPRRSLAGRLALEALEGRLCPSTLPTSPVPINITLDPTSQTVDAGTVVTFTAAATGTPAPRVQWQESTDGGVHFHSIPFATTDSLTFTAKSGQNGDEFRAVFTDPGERATTTDATLTVDFAPKVTHQPASQTVATGSQVTLTAAANGNPAPTVQWYTSTDGGATYSPISGATSDSYTFTAPSTPGSALYYAVFTSTMGTATTRVAKVTADVAPTVTSSPVSQTVDAGHVVTFTASATGTPAPRVHWEVSSDGGKTWHDIPLATTDSLTFTARAYQNGDEFQAVFTNGGGKATTSPATLTVQFGPTTTPPNVIHTAVNTQVTLTVNPTGNPPPTIQWYTSTDHGLTWTPIDGATSATYTFTTPSTPGSAWYDTVLTNSLGTVTTPPTKVTWVVPPAVTLDPTSQTVNAGTVVTFTAAASGMPTPHVQWQVSTDSGTTFHNLPLATTDSLTFTARAYENGEEFRAVFTEPGFRVTTTDATLTVDFGPSITRQPKSQTVATGSQVTLTADANGNPAPTVQWYSYNAQTQTWSAISGATSDSYTFTASTTPGATLYYALFTSANGTAKSKVATVTAVVPPTVTSNPVSQTVAAGTIVTFTASATGVPASTVQWQVSRDGGETWHAIPLATTDALTFTARAIQSGDEFRAVFTDGGVSTTTSAAILTVPVLDPA
jgi:hypothetical protein